MSPCLGLLPATAEPGDHPHPLTTLDHFRDNAFCSAALATKSEFSSSAITIDIHLLDPGVDRSMAELEGCRLEWSSISIWTSGGRGRDSESVQAIWKNVQAVAVLG